MANKTLTRDLILACSTLATELVDVPEWGGQVYVRELTGAERDAWEGGFVNAQGAVKEDFMVGARARLVALACVDAEGKRIFTDADVATLGQMPARGLNRVFGVASRLSGLSASDLAELEGNLPAGPAGDSGSV